MTSCFAVAVFDTTFIAAQRERERERERKKGNRWKGGKQGSRESWGKTGDIERGKLRKANTRH